MAGRLFNNAVADLLLTVFEQHVVFSKIRMTNHVRCYQCVFFDSIAIG